MIKLIAFLVLISFSGATLANRPVPYELPNRAEVLRTLNLVNDYFMEAYADYTLPSNIGRWRPSNIWTRGVYYAGLMHFYSIFPREDFYEYTYNWATYHNWSYRYGPTTRNADDYCAGIAYIAMYRLSPDPERIRKVKANLNMKVNTPQVNDWTWVDLIFMGMPVFAKLGVTLDEPKYFDKMWELYEYTRNDLAGRGLFNRADGLWWRDADFLPPYTEPNGEDCYWSRGNGWAYAGLAMVLNEIPRNATGRKQYLQDFMAMSEALAKVQREDGFWNVSLHDPNNFGGKETTGTSLFVYGMAWGVNNGILDRNKYIPIIMRAWNAMVKYSVHPNGFLGYVQSTGKEPKDGQPVTFDRRPDFMDYGVGCFLLAGVEVYKLEAASR